MVILKVSQLVIPDAMMVGVTYLHYPLAYTTAVIFPPASQNMRMMCVYIYI